jgi:hypothetical protein
MSINQQLELKNSLFKFIKADEYDLKNLENQELYCKFPSCFNDTYETHFGVVNIGADSNTLSNTISENMKIQRLCCFTRQWNNILMWAHYANGFKGAALVFDKTNLLKDGKVRFVGYSEEVVKHDAGILRIKYKPRPPVLGNNVIQAIKQKQLGNNRAKIQLVEATTLTKYKQWKYEQESRMIILLESHSHDKQPILYKYQETSLKGIIVGNKCPEKDIKEIAKKLPVDVHVYTARPMKDRYKLEINNVFSAGDIASERICLKGIEG